MVAVGLPWTASRDRYVSRSQHHTALYFFPVQPAIVNSPTRNAPTHTYIHMQHLIPRLPHLPTENLFHSQRNCLWKHIESFRSVVFSDWALWAPRRCPDASRCTEPHHRHCEQDMHELFPVSPLIHKSPVHVRPTCLWYGRSKMSGW